MTTFGAKLEHLLCSRAEIISRMHRPPPAEGNDLERLLNLPPGNNPATHAPPPNAPVWPDEQAAAFCAVAPPIETFMDVPDEIRRDQFYATCRRDDILVGAVSVVQDSGLVITILAYDQGPRRDFEGLKITGFCPLRQLPRYNTHGNALDAFQIGDKVRAFILDIHGGGRLILSMNSKMLNREIYGDLKLGIITDDDLPLYYKKLQNLDGKSYEAYLESTPQFRNPDGLQVLCARMGIPRSSACSLLFCINKIRLPKSEMACELRRTQLLNFSMKHVAQGVKYFKESRNTEALQCYNFAIEVEPTNPDAYVARGALYASIGTYTKAVEDLEKSLEIQPNHVNAKNYLGQTLVAYAGEIGRKEISKAEQLLNRALKLDPDNVEAKDALKELQTNGSLSSNKDAGLRTWSRSPSPRGSAHGSIRNAAGGTRRDPSPLSPVGSVTRPSERGGGGGYATHMERSRAALEQLVEKDRSRRAAASTKEGGGRQNHTLSDHSPPGFYSPNRSHDHRRRGGGDYSRDDSGRIIRCKDDDDMGDDSNRSDNYWKRSYDDDRHGPDNAKRSRVEAEPEYRSTRRVFTPPRNAREGEHGSLTVYDNENDLPMTSKCLQERVMQRVRVIERRHQMEDGGNPVGGADGAPANGPGVVGGGGSEKRRESSLTTDDAGPPPSDSPKGRGGDGDRSSLWRSGGNGPSGGGSSADRRSGGSFQRPEYRGSGAGGGYYGRNRPRGGAGGGSRWRGQYDDYRVRRNNWHNHRYDERRRDASGRAGSATNFERRRKRYGASGSVERSPRSSRSHSRSRSHVSKSRSRSYSRSPRSSSPSPSPIRPVNRGRVISRARIKTPPLAPLVTNFKRSESDENLAELDQFVAQLRAKRQLQQQFQQQQYMAQFQEMQGPTVNTPAVAPTAPSSQHLPSAGEYGQQHQSQASAQNNTSPLKITYRRSEVEQEENRGGGGGEHGAASQNDYNNGGGHDSPMQEDSPEPPQAQSPPPPIMENNEDYSVKGGEDDGNIPVENAAA
uniref:S1 motif domain-containing protein n=1 Tax=Trichobilharzia regenti TaxID=157069 RepID=A0AA85JMV7_TRIRE|nr:unnamed protein product [Trichobilharzia regenti]